MSIRIQIDTNFEDIAEAFSGLSKNDFIQGTRRAINRTLLTIRKIAIEELRKKVNLKPSVLRSSRYTQIKNAKGGSIGTLEGFMLFDNNSIPLLEFVKGPKSPRSQKGRKIKDRPKLKYEIRPGKVLSSKTAFVQKGGFSTQVFKRNKFGRFKAQRVESVGHLVLNKGVGERLQNEGLMMFEKTLRHEFQVRLDNVVKSVDNRSRRLTR